jgi:hypothetical protein
MVYIIEETRIKYPRFLLFFGVILQLFLTFPSKKRKANCRNLHFQVQCLLIIKFRDGRAVEGGISCEQLYENLR